MVFADVSMVSPWYIEYLEISVWKEQGLAKKNTKTHNKRKRTGTKMPSSSTTWCRSLRVEHSLCAVHSAGICAGHSVSSTTWCRSLSVEHSIALFIAQSICAGHSAWQSRAHLFHHVMGVGRTYALTSPGVRWTHGGPAHNEG